MTPLNLRRSALRAACVIVSLAILLPSAASQPISWAPMIWSPSNMGGRTIEHAALLLEVQIRGVEKPVRMQLDTGCDADLVYEIPFDQLGLDLLRNAKNRAVLAGTVGGRQFAREPFYIRSAGVSWLASLAMSIQQRIAIWKGKPVLLGTVGAAFLEHRVLLLDYVANRVAVLNDGDDVPAGLAWAPIDYRNHKIFVAVRVNGNLQRDLAFDTGSSSALSTTRTHWMEWTGRRPEDPNNTMMLAWAWDRYARLVGAPIQGALCVSSACLSSPPVFFESTGMPTGDFDRYPFHIAGLIGNALFDGRFTVAVDLPHRRFGLFRGSLARTSL